MLGKTPLPPPPRAWANSTLLVLRCFLFRSKFRSSLLQSLCFPPWEPCLCADSRSSCRSLILMWMRLWTCIHTCTCMNVSIRVLDSRSDSTYNHIHVRILSTYSVMHGVRSGKGLHLMDSFNRSQTTKLRAQHVSYRRQHWKILLDNFIAPTLSRFPRTRTSFKLFAW